MEGRNNNRSKTNDGQSKKTTHDDDKGKGIQRKQEQKIEDVSEKEKGNKGGYAPYIVPIIGWRRFQLFPPWCCHSPNCFESP